MLRLQNSRLANWGQTVAIFGFHMALFGALAAALFAVGHELAFNRAAAGVALAVFAWAFTAAWEQRIQPAQPKTAEAADSPWRALALGMLELTLPVAALTAQFHAELLAAGALLLAAGAGLRLWSLATLGVHFTWTTGVIDGHMLVRTGPYRYGKHPNYLGSVVFAAGVALAAGSLWALLPVGLMAAAVVATARHEEAFLRARLPGYGTRPTKPASARTRE